MTSSIFFRVANRDNRASPVFVLVARSSAQLPFSSNLSSHTSVPLYLNPLLSHSDGSSPAQSSKCASGFLSFFRHFFVSVIRHLIPLSSLKMSLAKYFPRNSLTISSPFSLLGFFPKS